MLRRSPRHSEATRELAQVAEGVGVPGNVPQIFRYLALTVPADSASDIDVLDTKLFTNEYEIDFNLWFAKATFQYHLAMAIQKEHLGHTVINPKDVLEQVEAGYWKEPSRNAGGSGSSHYPRFELFTRINAARATKDDKTLQVFLDQLSTEILSNCRRLRNNQVAELDADMPYSPSQIYRVAIPSSATSSTQSLEDSGEATGTPTDAESPSQDGGVHIGNLSIQDSIPLSQPVEAAHPVHRYTSILYEYAARFGKEPEYKKKWISLKKWRCEAVFDGVHGVGEACNWKDAKHIASQKICKALGIVEGKLYSHSFENARL
ncbi:hypothetical protein K469DRAFT_748135 [Zopfia rhizophila CBS 207.26]|uniref:DRBM domain-containing protein n=1 Tax=Zopfia rhizophila CBS 207.26 TaxID=1314779 RepID=A0A6A6ECY0_9PEZI|nr:hypothetical protein K469DRAFT_748135 [Zopfia rhizophila CBS 207.26]